MSEKFTYTNVADLETKLAAMKAKIEKLKVNWKYDHELSGALGLENKRLREALEIYANENNWGRSDDGWVDWNSDGQVPFKNGDPYNGGVSIARAALDGGKA